MNFKQRLKARKESLAHYNRMIAAAKRLDKKNPKVIIANSTSNRLISECGEAPTGHYCAFCDFTENYCGACPLAGKYKSWAYCCNGLWCKMGYASNWKQWIKAAKRVRRYIFWRALLP